MRRAALLALAALCAAPLFAQGGASPAASSSPAADAAAKLLGFAKGRPLGGAALDAETKRVSSLLRCPVCQGLSVADSPSSMALNMRAEVRELVAAGYTEEQILGYFERSYGEFVRLQPPLRGVNWLVWGAPVLGLLVGAALVAWVLRSPRRAARLAEAPAPSVAVQPAAADSLPDDPELAKYVLRVRELAYGWPGGVRPEKAS